MSGLYPNLAAKFGPGLACPDRRRWELNYLTNVPMLPALEVRFPLLRKRDDCLPEVLRGHRPLFELE